MKLTQSALGSSRLTFFVAMMLLLGGIFTFLGFPSQEEPSITVREALVSVVQPGLPTEQVERLLARPVEERLREIAGIKRVVTTVRPGMAIIQLTAYDDVADLPALWQRVRSKAAEAEAALPEGAYGPFIDDEFGRVAVASVAITAPGFSTSEMRAPLRDLRAHLYTIAGVERVSMHGLQEDQVYIDFDRAKLAEAGLTPAQVSAQLQGQNIVSPGGLVSASGMSFSMTTSGEISTVEDLQGFLLTAQRDGVTREVALGQLARIHVMPVDPPQSAAVYQGQPAVVVAVSMGKGLNVAKVGQELRKKLEETAELLPAGFQQHVVTFQADVVDQEMSKMHHVMAETIIIVMAVVMLFLGWRTGLIVGAIVPLTILGSLIVMRVLSIELQSVSIAAIIIALGLLVDNGIVIAEDIERRLGEGEGRWQACEAAGRTLAIPLLTSSLVIVLAFSPFFFGNTATNEYLRSLPVVLGVTLLGSWLLSITVTPLLCLFFAKAHVAQDHAPQNYDSRFYRGYRRIIETLLQHRLLFIGSMMGLLASAIVVLGSIPYDFLPKSDRLQFQIPVTLEPGADSRQTMQAVQSISRWLADKKVNPEIVDSIGYVADGGPRIVLGLNPPLPAPNIGYFTVSIKPETDIDQVIARTRSHIRANFPQLRAEPKRFSLGATEAGLAVYRVTGPDEDVLRAVAGQIAQALKALPGTIDVYDDWQARIPRYVVDVDSLKARRAGITHQDVAKALEMRFSGTAISVVREEGVNTPIVMRGSATERNGRADPGDTPIYPQNGGVPVALSAIATVTLSSEPSTLVRRNLERTITVTGQNPAMTATEIVSSLQASIEKIDLPPGYRISLGGEIEDSAEANDALTQFLPHALGGILLLFIWQFNSFRKLFIVIASVPFVLIGATLALVVTGFPFGFMATFGLLALAGIIVNNAVLLLERIEAELKSGLSRREAVVAAAVKRLRPIVMTKLVCIVGLVPLMLFAGPLWTSMAITMIGGLALGTLVTLGLIPILYETLFSLRVPSLDARGAPEAQP